MAAQRNRNRKSADSRPTRGQQTQEPAGHVSQRQLAPADPPRKHPLFLAASTLLLAAWLVFLVTMALRG